MGQLVVTEFVTLDGVMEAPGGEPTHRHTGWVEPFFTPEIGELKGVETIESERLLIGRVTYESFAGAWPTYEGEMAVKMNTMPKHVVTGSTAPLEWENSHVLEGDLTAAVRDLVASSAGTVLVAGSCQLVHALLRADLVDELRLMVFPVAIGGGRLRVFPDDGGDLLRYDLADTRSFSSGVVQLTYRRHAA
jgi:dihydrofolate reductase